MMRGKGSELVMVLGKDERVYGNKKGVLIKDGWRKKGR